MPVTEIPLDSSTQEENVTLLHGRNILIKLIEDQKTLQFFVDPNVKSFVSTEDMTCKEFREPIQKMIKLDEEIEQILQGKYEAGVTLMLDDYVRAATIRLQDWTMSPPLGKKGKRLKDKDAMSIKRETEDLRKRIVERMIKDLSDKDDLIINLEKELKSFNSNLNLLTTLVISRCPKCGSFISEEKSSQTQNKPNSRLNSRNDYLSEIFSSTFLTSRRLGQLIEVREKTKCSACGNMVTPRNALNFTLHRLQPPIKRIWESNLWFEEYLSIILKSFGWKTWPHVHVLGSSGIRHEVDILGVKEGYVLVCECKTGNVSRQDVFNFWTKTYDIKSHLSILALIQGLPEPETRQFILKNPSVTLLENLGQSKKTQIINELKGSVIQRI